MIKTINLYDFERAFVDMNRADQFTYAGKKALFEYLEQYEEETGEPVELDVIALCCEYSEYKSLADFHKDYNGDKYETIEEIAEQTTVIRIGEIDGEEAFIIQQF